MRSNIIALWMVHGENYQNLMTEAKADAGLFGIDLRHDPLAPVPLAATTYELQLIKCSPVKIEEFRVELWKGWAVITWGFVEPQLVLHTIAEEERSILERQWQASLSS